MKTLRVAVCLPSKNEENSIEEVVRKVDLGLGAFGDPKDHLIVNVDSGSTDRTVEFFLRTETKTPKISLKTSYGKGGNIREFLNFVILDSFNVFGTFDTDLVSLSPAWIVEMTRIVAEGTDFVVPEYQRSPFEGSTTNHFCFPLVFALFGKQVRQPIGGDFMFGRSFAEAIHQELSFPPTTEVLSYGIDIFLTISALNMGFKIGKASLGKKIHNPGHEKMENMFQQVAQSTFSLIRNLKGVLTNRSTDVLEYEPMLPNLKEDSTRTISYSHREFGLHLRKKNIEKILRNRFFYKSFISEDFPFLEKCLEKEELDTNRWIHFLKVWIEKGIQGESSPAELAEHLVPLFIWRAVTYWEYAASVPLKNSEGAILYQASELRNRLTFTPLNRSFIEHNLASR